MQLTKQYTLSQLLTFGVVSILLSLTFANAEASLHEDSPSGLFSGLLKVAPTPPSPHSCGKISNPTASLVVAAVKGQPKANEVKQCQARCEETPIATGCRLTGFLKKRQGNDAFNFYDCLCRGQAVATPPVKPAQVVKAAKPTPKIEPTPEAIAKAAEGSQYTVNQIRTYLSELQKTANLELPSAYITDYSSCITQHTSLCSLAADSYGRKMKKSCEPSDISRQISCRKSLTQDDLQLMNVLSQEAGLGFDVKEAKQAMGKWVLVCVPQCT